MQVSPWQYVVGGICNLILAIKFCKVVANEHKENDWATRKSFARTYFIIGVVVSGILQVLALVAALFTFKSQCMAQGNTQNQCDVIIGAVVYSWSIGLFLSLAWNCYLTHVCKLYAALADPANQRQQVNPASANYHGTDQAYAQQPQAYQPLPAQQVQPGQPVMQYAPAQPGQPVVYQGTNVDNVVPDKADKE